MQVYGVDAVVRIISHFIFIYLAFWALGSIRLETFFRPRVTRQVRVVLWLLAVVIGYTASSFFFEILTLFRNIFQTFS